MPVEEFLSVSSIADLPFDHLKSLDVVVVDSSPDSHVAVLCAILGIRVIRPDKNDELVLPEVGEDESISQNLQLAVANASDIEYSQDWSDVDQFFIRWEHILYPIYQRHGTLEELLQATTSALQDAVRAAWPTPVILRLPDVRSDDPMARVFGLDTEPNPALGVHGARYWLKSPRATVDAVLEVFSALPDNALLAVPFVTTFDEYRALASKLKLELLVPFVETPYFLHDYAQFEECPRICFGLKDFSYLLFAADREARGRSWVADAQLIEAGLEAAANPIRHLLDKGVQVSIYTPPGSIGQFSRILRRTDWTASMPFGELRRRRSLRMGAGQ